MNTYQAFYRKKKTTVEAPTSLDAQRKAATYFKAKKSYEVTVVLTEKNGKQITHSTGSL